MCVSFSTHNNILLNQNHTQRWKGYHFLKQGFFSPVLAILVQCASIILCFVDEDRVLNFKENGVPLTYRCIAQSYHVRTRTLTWHFEISPAECDCVCWGWWRVEVRWTTLWLCHYINLLSNELCLQLTYSKPYVSLVCRQLHCVITLTIEIPLIRSCPTSTHWSCMNYFL